MNRYRAALLILLVFVCALFGAAALRAPRLLTWETNSSGLPSSGSVRDVAFGDINNNGLPELMVTSTSGSGLSLYGRGSGGTWSATGLNTGLPASGSYEQLAVGDLDVDGKPDLFASRGSGTGLAVWKGNGSGSWTAITGGLPATGTYKGVALADVNGDGQPDLLAAGNGSGAVGVAVYRNDLTSFTALTGPTSSGVYNQLAAGYVNTDHYVDLAATNETTGVYFWKGQAAAGWSAARTGLPSGAGFRGLALGDLDNDSWPELVVSRAGTPPLGGGIGIYDWNDTSGSWTLAANQILTTVCYGRIVLSDLNNDGWLDVLAVGYPGEGGQGLTIWLGSAAGFTAAASPSTASSLGSLAAADFDLSGLVDLAAGDTGSLGASAWRNSASPNTMDSWLELPTPQATGSPLSLGQGDLNRDGYLDVILPGSSGGLVGYLGNGGNSWSECTGLAKAVPSGTFGDILAGVFPQIGTETSIIAARTDNGGLAFVYGTTCAGGGGASAIASTGSYRGLSAGEIFRDGNLSIVAAVIGVGTGMQYWVQRNTGWTIPVSIASGYSINDTALGDVDHDGLLEIATAELLNDGVAIYDYGKSWTRRSVVGMGSYYAVSLGDINNDGHLDVVATPSSAGTGIRVWLGNGSGTSWTLSSGPDAASPLTYYDLDLTDFNRDGKLDILAGTQGQGVLLWAGNGAGSWTPAAASLPASGNFRHVAFGHIDRDGNPDLLSTQTSGGVRLWSASDAAAPTITPYRATLWINSTQSPVLTAKVIDSGRGIDIASGGYRYSTNGGGSWSGWLAAAVSGENASTKEQIITTPAVPFSQDSQTLNVVEFRASDLGANQGTAQSVIWIDTTPPVPTSLFSPDREANTWSAGGTINLTFGVTDAVSGWQDSSVLVDQSSSTVPPAAANATGIHYTTGSLADGNWYAHLRGRDGAGNWSTTTRHFGPWGIDTTPPSNPYFLHSTDHAKQVWSNDVLIDMFWNGAADAGSGVHGYSYVMDTSPETLPDTIKDTAANTVTMSRTTGNSYYFHLRTGDAVGNWAPTAIHAGPYYIDTIPPVSSVTSPAHTNNQGFTVSWSGSDAHSGIASYDIQSRNRTANDIWRDWKTEQTATSAIYSGLDGYIYEFRSRARDNAGNVEAWPSYADSTTPVETIDFSLQNPAVEITQSSQDLDNSVQVYANRRTFVFCYPQQNGSVQHAGVTARLKIFNNEVYMGIATPINPDGVLTIGDIMNRGSMNGAFLFDVPSIMVREGMARFQCEINYGRNWAESDYSNNIASGSVVVTRTGVLNVNLVDVLFYAPDGLHTVRHVDRNRIVAYLRAAYPVQFVNPVFSTLNPPYEYEPDMSDVLSDLDANVNTADENMHMHHYGMMYWPGSRTGAIGLGRISGLVATGYLGPSNSTSDDGTWGEETAAHEIGHNLGRLHVHCAGTEDDDGNGGLDDDYPYPVDSISPTETGRGAVYGIDGSTTPPRILRPGSTTDIMSYCANQWLSPYTYVNIRNILVDRAMARATEGLAATPIDRLAVYGKVVKATDAVTLKPFYRLMSATDHPGRDPNGAYSIRFFGDGGSLLQNYRFSPAWTESPGTTGSITERPPWVTGTRRIAIFHGETELASRTVSAHAPQVAMVSPVGGQNLSGASVTVSWTASDQDGDALGYRLAFSRDAGASWQGISRLLTQTSAAIELNTLPGTTQGKFRVTASDGVNTAQAETSGVFSIPFKVPEIVQFEPAGENTYPRRQTVNFRGLAYDAEDNVLPDDRLSWRSSLMGVLGTGRLQSRIDLIPGRHEITLTATDSQGNAVSAGAVVIVLDSEETYSLFLPFVVR